MKKRLLGLLLALILVLNLGVVVFAEPGGGIVAPPNIGGPVPPGGATGASIVLECVEDYDEDDYQCQP